LSRSAAWKARNPSCCSTPADQGDASAAQAPTSGCTWKGALYEWYLKELAADKDPVGDERAALSEHVSARLLQQIERKRRSPDGMEADYFIQAQDYLDDWLGQVTVKAGKINKSTAKVDATLGEKPDDMRTLRVTLVFESGVWKISHVQAATR
jgi:hypothetical protein